MASISTNAEFIVWGIDQTPYGPVELPALVSWVKDERVTAETWIFVCKNQAWQRAAEVIELQMFFRARANGTPAGATALEAVAGIDPRALRRVKILGGMNDTELGRFAQFMQVE